MENSRHNYTRNMKYLRLFESKKCMEELTFDHIKDVLLYPVESDKIKINNNMDYYDPKFLSGVYVNLYNDESINIHSVKIRKNWTIRFSIGLGESRPPVDANNHDIWIGDADHGSGWMREDINTYSSNYITELVREYLKRIYDEYSCNIFAQPHPRWSATTREDILKYTTCIIVIQKKFTE